MQIKHLPNKEPRGVKAKSSFQPDSAFTDQFDRPYCSVIKLGKLMTVMVSGATSVDPAPAGKEPAFTASCRENAGCCLDFGTAASLHAPTFCALF